MRARTGCFYRLLLASSKTGAVKGWSRDPAHGQLVKTTLGWPSPPSGSAGLCFGALAQARLRCGDLGDSLLAGPCALFLGCSAGI